MGILDWIKNWFGGDVKICHQCGRQFRGTGWECPLCEPPSDTTEGQSESAPVTTSPAASDPVKDPGELPKTSGVDRFSATPRQVDFAPSSEGATKPIPKVRKSRSNVQLSNLDASRFEPMTLAEANALTSVPHWRRAHGGWDSRSHIPPKNLERVKIINQLMVGFGILSPEELIRIYELNEQYSAYKSHWQQLEDAAQLAIQRSREERRRIREQKKAEAAERKRKRQAEIRERWETDIVFLGRGVSKGLADRQSMIEILQEKDLPVLATPFDVAQALGISIKRLRWLAFHDVALRRAHYVYFDVPREKRWNAATGRSPAPSGQSPAVGFGKHFTEAADSRVRPWVCSWTFDCDQCNAPRRATDPGEC